MEAADKHCHCARADVIEAECELDEEVAQLMEPGTLSHRQTQGDIKLVVQDYGGSEGGDGGETTEAEADPDLPDLGWVTDYRSSSDWDKPHHNILFPKSATFPRQSQKVEEQEAGEAGLYYGVVLGDSHRHRQYNYIQNFPPYRGKQPACQHFTLKRSWINLVVTFQQYHVVCFEKYL